MTICIGTWLTQYINRLNTEIVLWEDEAGCDIDTIPIPKGVCLREAIVDLWAKMKEVSERRYQQAGASDWNPCNYAATYGCIEDVTAVLDSIDYTAAAPVNHVNPLFGCDPLIPDGLKYRITGLPAPWDTWNTDLGCMSWSWPFAGPRWAGNPMYLYWSNPFWNLQFSPNDLAANPWANWTTNFDPCNPEGVYPLTPVQNCNGWGIYAAFCAAAVNNMVVEVRYYDSPFTT